VPRRCFLSLLSLTALDVGHQQQQQQEEDVSARVTDHRNTIFPAAVGTRRRLPGVGARQHLARIAARRKAQGGYRRDATRRGAVASNRVDRGDDENDDRGRKNARCNNRTTLLFTGLPCLPSDTKQNQAHTTDWRSPASDDDDDESVPWQSRSATATHVATLRRLCSTQTLDTFWTSVNGTLVARSRSRCLALAVSLARSLGDSVSSCRFLSSPLLARHATARHVASGARRSLRHHSPPVEIALARGHSTTAVAHRLTHTARANPPDVLPRLTSATPARCLARLTRLTSRRDSTRTLTGTAVHARTADGIPAPLQPVALRTARRRRRQRRRRRRRR